ncbi:MAG: type IV pilus assembly protein PilM [Patescibacteria group bacterium]
MWPFKKLSKNFLGIDIGTSAIKVVELARERNGVRLENYGEMSVQTLLERPFRTIEGDNLLLSDQDIAKALTAIFKSAKFRTKEAFFSIPDFSSFFTFLELPPMTQEEVNLAVKFEARRHIPLPLSEVALDWIITNENPNHSKNTPKLKILLVAVPYETVNQYKNIATFSKINLISLEAEVFGLTRSLVKNKKGIVGLVDMGAQSTTFSIVENGFIVTTHSFDISMNELTKVLSKSLNIRYNEAEELKKKYGLTSSDKSVGAILGPLIDLLVREIEKISQNFYQAEGKKVEKIIFAGGGALLPGLSQYLSSSQRPVSIANPFEGFIYPKVLEGTLRIMGPSYAVAVGMALRGFEKK